MSEDQELVFHRTEKFVAVVDDVKKSTYVWFFGRDGGKTKARQIQRKISKKVGPCLVLSLTETYNSEILLSMYPEPRANYLYREHPYDANRLIGVNKFHEVVMEDKRRQFCSLFKSIGAKSIRFHTNPQWNIEYHSPPPLKHDLLMITEKFKTLKTENTWRKAVRERLSDWSEMIDVNFSYLDDFSINDTVLEVLTRKMGCSEKERNLMTGF